MHSSIAPARPLSLWLTSLLSVLLLTGCGPSSLPEVAGVTDSGVTLIAFDSNNAMLDFVSVRSGDPVDKVVFMAPDDGSDIKVVAIGPSVHPDLPPNQVVTSRQAEGFQGKVTAQFKEGVLQQLMGNGIEFASPLEASHLENIGSKIQSGTHQPAEFIEIIKVDPAILELIGDGQGNQTPADLSAAEETFLKAIIDAIEAKDLEALKAYTHRDADDRSRLSTVDRYWESVLERDLHHYRFMRFSKTHPDNRAKMETHDGRSIRHSLEPKWLLTIYHTPEDAYMVYSADLIIGEDEGQLKFPTAYID